MSIKLLEIKKESCPAARLIGKKQAGSPNWNEWWENNRFEKLEEIPCIPFNGDAYIGAVHIVDGMPERWIGMLFPAGTEVPEGFEAVDIEPLEYAVCTAGITGAVPYSMRHPCRMERRLRGCSVIMRFRKSTRSWQGL